MSTEPIVLTIEVMPSDCNFVIGMVSASCCLSKSIVGDMSANVKNWTIGGELEKYSQLIDDALEIAKDRLIVKAKKRKAKAIIGVRIGTTQVSEGAAEVIIYGTAVN